MELFGFQQLVWCAVLSGLLGVLFGSAICFLVTNKEFVRSVFSGRQNGVRPSSPKSRYFFDRAVAEGESTIVWVMAVPNHCGRTIESAFRGYEALKSKLRNNGITFSDDGVGSLGAEIDFCGSSWEKRVMLVRIKVRLKMPIDAARRALIDGGFVEGSPAPVG